MPADDLIVDQAPSYCCRVLHASRRRRICYRSCISRFASAANAEFCSGTLPMAMSRDGLMSTKFLELSRFGTPIWGIILTGAGMSFVVIAFGAGAIAKLASAFVLVKLALVNLAVIVLRSAKISSYAPGFKTPSILSPKFLVSVSLYISS